MPETSDSESDGPANREGSSSRTFMPPKKKQQTAAIPKDLSAKEKIVKEIILKKPKESPADSEGNSSLVKERKPRKRKRTKGRVQRQGGAPNSEHNVLTHFPFNPLCEVCLNAKMQKAPHGACDLDNRRCDALPDAC